MKLITTIGTGNYSEALYRLNPSSSDIRTAYFPVAVAQWFKPQSIYVLLTSTAQNHANWQNCKQELLKHLPADHIHEVSIPDGKNEAELWQIFEAITSVVNEGDELIIDITHGFRSLPMLALLAIAYLRQVKGVKLQAILYGAYEARDQDAIVPVFDLTPFVSLLDWLAAAKIFMATGNGSELADLMRRAQAQAHKTGHPQPPKQLITLSDAVKAVSENLLTNRVPKIPPAVRELVEVLDDAQTQQEIRQWLPPLVPLLDQVKASYAPFAEDTLEAQARLIEWYARHGHAVHAITLAREWLVSYELEQSGGDKMDVKQREQASEALNARAKTNASSLVVLAWRELSGLRNDIAHCGFREGSAKANALQAAAEKAYQDIRAILMATSGSSGVSV
ncbi:MAG: TIGR02221 family CRISPR-associated protein [Fimbriimonadales bacterium]